MRAGDAPARAIGPDGHDDEIRAALAAGDGDHAFKRLQHAYAHRGYGLALRLMRDAALAEDVMQESLLQVFQGLAALREHRSLHAWVMTVIAHRSFDALRKRNRRQRRVIETDDLADVSDGTAAPPDRLIAVEEVLALEHSLGSLSPKVRAAVLLRFGHELTFLEIGLLLGEDADTVRARVTRALPLLRWRMGRLGHARQPAGPVSGEAQPAVSHRARRVNT